VGLLARILVGLEEAPAGLLGYAENEVGLGLDQAAEAVRVELLG